MTLALQAYAKLSFSEVSFPPPAQSFVESGFEQIAEGPVLGGVLMTGFDPLRTVIAADRRRRRKTAPPPAVH
jgi:hypothetical protein